MNKEAVSRPHELDFTSRTPPAVAEETEFRVNSAETLVVSCMCPPSLQSCAVCACIPPFIVLLFGLQRQRALNAELGVKGVLGSRADLITWLEEAV